MKKIKLADNIKDRLRASTITPATCNPSNNVKDMNHVVIFVGDEPFLSTGYWEDEESQKEAEMLMNSDVFHKIVGVVTGIENPDIHLVRMFGEQIDWKTKEYCISRSDAGKVKDGIEDGAVVWFLFDDNALATATALCISPEIEEIARELK